MAKQRKRSPRQDQKKIKYTRKPPKAQPESTKQTNKPAIKESPKKSWDEPRRTYQEQEEYRFLNPYNFVRYLPAPNPPANDPDAQLLARCSPPPHDRYIGLTGRMTCTLETESPLFISDSHQVKAYPAKGDKEHYSHRFFQYEGQDAIPATSLRGMIRSVFEIITNSPFSVFDSEERLEYRLDPAQTRRFKPGIVRSTCENGELGTIALCKEAKVGAYYPEHDSNVLDPSWKCGDEAYALIVQDDNNVQRVEVLSRDGNHLSGNVQSGWLKITGRTIDTKCNESFFYFSGDSDKAKEVSFDSKREADYNDVLAAQLEREDFKSQIQNKRLTIGDLVYVELENDNAQVRNIALVRVARLRYRQKIGDLLLEHLKPSICYDQLDIASRLFGWVRDAHRSSPQTSDDDGISKSEQKLERVAYAGRLRFSHATLTEDGDKGVYEQDMPLAILGSPKPTTTLFYLENKKGSWSEEERKATDFPQTIGYDGDNQLRGRKVYRHHGDALNRQEYERAGQEKEGHQNRTVRGVRVPGNKFEFTVEFHNLAPVELGALLWTLKIGEKGCYYRLGYAKPLGFGSVKLTVDDISLLDVTQRYAKLNDKGGWRHAKGKERDDWLSRFEEAMKCCYGHPLRELDNILDLFALLREPKAQLPQHIHYPRSKPTPDPEGKNFKWFMENKRKSKQIEKAGPNHVLEIASDESEGLPLLGDTS